MTQTRTDAHRPSVIVPADYAHVLSYDLPTQMPGVGVNCERDRAVCRFDETTGRIVLVSPGRHDADGRCCLTGLSTIAHVRFAETGGTGQCSTCGAHFLYGDVWVHVPTGEHIHLGHQCADKYALLVDRSAYQLALGRRQAAAAAQLQRVANWEARTAFLAAHPGLAEDLQQAHPILRDLSAKLTQYHSLSDKQIAFAATLAAEVRNPAPAEQHVAAPTGTVTVRGTVVSVKVHEGAYGTSLKMTVKVQTPAGSWLAWGTVPTSLDVAKGATVQFVATLQAGNDPHFAFFKRPRQAVVLGEVAA
jgi:hypothetical protein